MNIVIEPAAREYILKKSVDKAINIRIKERPGIGRVGQAYYLSVQLGKIEPHQMHSFNKIVIDDTEVYYLDRLPEIFKSITVKIEKMLFFKNLVASGDK
ncbi:MAG TPA: hypothetical protein PKA28_17400 [Methylomusa anaerophila]|uniref:Uncharacterized protein n=1 Tax=Methylomusa anaerophila TaxID=1930071 RepID=A0A348AMM1_9FIRM|nr:hypothetical protein [Methylomusa anaerophila]BBB92319.1 hypothetical protein MAMMFC1_03005 [Methylomusa anaerophila]HML90220.1 hypothetical protein [Methylomusa anaerophila]